MVYGKMHISTMCKHSATLYPDDGEFTWCDGVIAIRHYKGETMVGIGEGAGIVINPDCFDPYTDSVVFDDKEELKSFIAALQNICDNM